MRWIYLLIALCSFLKSFPQVSFDNYISDSLPVSSFYLVGQGHNNAANTIIEEKLLTTLNRKHGLRYDILEISPSAAFLVNQYLRTGQDSFLYPIDENAPFSFIRNIKSHNDSVPAHRTIRFYGIDFENRKEGQWTKKALGLIAGEMRTFPDDPFKQLLVKASNAPAESMEAVLLTLKDYLYEQDSSCRQSLGDHYLDLLLIVNSPVKRNYGRDKYMFANFLLLYKELSKKETQPLFLASFGIGHNNPKNEKGLAMLLQNAEESPVKNQVSNIGVQYYHAQFGKEGTTKPTYGNLDFLCKKEGILKALFEVTDRGTGIRIFKRNEFQKIDCSSAINNFAALLMINNYKASSHWTWE